MAPCYLIDAFYAAEAVTSDGTLSKIITVGGKIGVNGTNASFNLLDENFDLIITVLGDWRGSLSILESAPNPDTNGTTLFFAYGGHTQGVDLYSSNSCPDDDPIGCSILGLVEVNMSAVMSAAAPMNNPFSSFLRVLSPSGYIEKGAKISEVVFFSATLGVAGVAGLPLAVPPFLAAFVAPSNLSPTHAYLFYAALIYQSEPQAEFFGYSIIIRLQFPAGSAMCNFTNSLLPESLSPNTLACFIPVARWSLLNDGVPLPELPAPLLGITSTYYNCSLANAATDAIPAAYTPFYKGAAEGGGGGGGGSGCTGQSALIFIATSHRVNVFALDLSQRDGNTSNGVYDLVTSAPETHAFDARSVVGPGYPGDTAEITAFIVFHEVVLASPPEDAPPTPLVVKPSSVWLIVAVADSPSNPTSAMEAGVLVRLPQFSDAFVEGSADAGNYPPSRAPSLENPAGYVTPSPADSCDWGTFWNGLSCIAVPYQIVYTDLYSVTTKLQVEWRALPPEMSKALIESNCPLYNVSCLANWLNNNATIWPPAIPVSPASTLTGAPRSPRSSSSADGSFMQSGTGDAESLAARLQSEVYGNRFVVVAPQTASVINVGELLPLGCLDASGVGLYVMGSNQLSFLGPPLTVQLTQNAQYIFGSVSRFQYALNSMERVVEICEALLTNPTDPFLAPYADTCSGGSSSGVKPRLPLVSDFIQIASACLPGLWCQSFSQEILALVPAGDYSTFGFDVTPCEPGNICPQGIKEICPQGFQCPFPHMSLPQPCSPDPSLNTSCYQQGLSAPLLCPPGTLCGTPYLPPIPAPPNWAVSYDPVLKKRVLSACHDGQWCSSGRDVSEGSALNCTAAFSCPSPGVLEPSVCNDGGACNSSECPSIPYCPSGTQYEEPCPPGTYCSNTTTSTACSLGTLCQAGSPLWSLCPAGYYCPSPDATVPCPAQFYCPEGSIAPVPCNFLVTCKCNSGGGGGPGCSEPPFDFVLVLTASIVFSVIALFILWKAWLGDYIARCMKERERARLKLEKKLRKASERNDRPSLNVPLLSSSTSSLNLNSSPTENSRSDGESPFYAFPASRSSMLEGALLNSASSSSRGDAPPPPPSSSADVDKEAAASYGLARAVSISLGFSRGAPTPRPTSSSLGMPPRQTSLSLLSSAVLAASALTSAAALPAALPPPPEPSTAQSGAPLPPPDELVVTPKTFRIDIRFEGLGLSLKSGNKKSVLRGVTGTLRSGRVCAIMGPSGAGKTTMLTALCGKASYGTLSGKVFINEVPGLLTDPQYKHLVGFVPQEDIMMRDMTVEENIRFSALTRLPFSWSLQRKTDFADAVITLLGLDAIRDSLIGDENQRGISGGQRKRVNVGIQMASDPTVLFLDEPTSGLDATGSMQVCNALKRIADLGLTVALVLHQPRYEIFAQFNDLLLLGPGGRTVYIGPVSDAMPYFSRKLNLECPQKTNEADFMLDVVGGSLGGVPAAWRQANPDFKPEQLFTMWEHELGEISRREGRLPLDPSAPPPPLPPPHEPTSFLSLVFFYFKRSIAQQLRHPGMMIINNIMPLASALFLAALYYGDPSYAAPLPIEAFSGCSASVATAAQVCIAASKDSILQRGLMTIISVALTGVASFLPVFGFERIVYWREASELPQPRHTVAYFLGKDLAQLPQLLLGPFMFTNQYVAVTNPRASFGTYYYAFAAVYFVSSSFAYLTAVLAPPNLAQLLGVTTIFVNAIFAGGNPTLAVMRDKFIPLCWLPAMSFMRYALEALYAAEVSNYSDVVSLQGLSLQTIVSNEFGYDLGAFSIDITAIFLIGFLVRILSLTAMIMKDSDKKK